jgi:hypothetical protein
MRSTHKIFFAEKTTTINPAKIIHRVIISIDSRVLHTILIITVLTAINSTSRSLITSSPSLYLINSRGKIVS